jgi:hypothetical protein
MSSLSAFMSQNAVKIDNLKKVVSKRFLDETGKPIEWEICAITSEEDEQIRKDCTKRVPVPGARGQFTKETDYMSYVGKLAARCTVFPNLNDAELQNSYGVMGDDKLLKAMLTGGEYAEYLITVQSHNGFDVPLTELVEEAKN